MIPSVKFYYRQSINHPFEFRLLPEDIKNIMGSGKATIISTLDRMAAASHPNPDLVTYQLVLYEHRKKEIENYLFKSLIDNTDNIHSRKEEKLKLFDSECLRVYTSHGPKNIIQSKIIRLRGDGAYANLFLDNAIKHTLPHNLHFYSLRLNTSFVRIHKSHIINVEKIKSFCTKAKSYVVMSDDVKISVSRSFQPSVMST